MTNPDNEKKDKARKEYERAVNLNLDSRRRLTGLLVGGNAGGSLASLTVFGSMLSGASQNPIPEVLFWLLTAFLLGLFGCLVERFADCQIRGIIAFEKYAPVLFGKEIDLDQSNAIQRWSNIEHRMQIFSFSTLICGTIYNGTLEIEALETVFLVYEDNFGFSPDSGRGQGAALTGSFDPKRSI